MVSMSRIRLILSLFCVATLAVSPSVAQPQEVEESTGSLQLPPKTPTMHVHAKLSDTIFPNIGFDDSDKPKKFADFARKFEAAISSKGKAVQIVIDTEAFQHDKKEPVKIAHEIIFLPPVPTKLVANTALRLAIAQIGGGEASYWIRRGQILITTAKKVHAGEFLNAEVNARFEKRPLVDALDELAEITGVSIIVDHRVRAKANTPVTAIFPNAKLRSAVETMADAADLKVVVATNVIYVTSAENARRFKVVETWPLGPALTGIVQKHRKLGNAIEDFHPGNLVFDSRVEKKLNTRINAKWINTLDYDIAISILTDMAELRPVVIDDILYITTPANAEKLQKKELDKRPPPEPQLYPVQIDGKIGLINQQGKLVVPAIYDHAFPMVNGYCSVALKGKRGLINRDGKVVVEPKYAELENVHDGLVRMADDQGKYGFIDVTGKQVIPATFEYAFDFSDGLARVMGNGKSGYIDRTGKQVIEGNFKDASSFTEGIALVQVGHKFRFIDTAGKFLFGQKKFDTAEPFADGLAAFTVGGKIPESVPDDVIGGKWGFIDRKGNVVIKPRFDHSWGFSEGLAGVNVGGYFGGKWGFIDKSGRYVVEPKYRWLENFSEGLAVVRDQKYKAGFIDKTGRLVIETKFDNAWSFSGGLAKIGIGPFDDGKHGYVDRSGRIVWEPTR